MKRNYKHPSLDSKELERFVAKASADPDSAIKKCRAEYSAARKGYQRSQQEALAKVYTLAFVLISDPDRGSKFLENCAWTTARTRKSRLGPDQSMLVALAVEVMGNSSTKRALKYAKALTWLLEARIEPRHVMLCLTRAGIEAMIAIASRVSRRKRPKQSNAKCDRAEAEACPPADPDWDYEEPDSTSKSVNNLPEQARPLGRAKAAYDPSTNLVVELGNNELQRLMTLPNDAEVDLTIKLSQPRAGWRSAIAISIEGEAQH
jgi:hypothetical protein